MANLSFFSVHFCQTLVKVSTSHWRRLLTICMKMVEISGTRTTLWTGAPLGIKEENLLIASRMKIALFSRSCDVIGGTTSCLWNEGNFIMSLPCLYTGAAMRNLKRK